MGLEPKGGIADVRRASSGRRRALLVVRRSCLRQVQPDRLAGNPDADTDRYREHFASPLFRCHQSDPDALRFARAGRNSCAVPWLTI